MKILFLSPYIPIPPTFGGALRIYHLLKGLSKINDVTLLTFGENREKKMLEEYKGKLFNDFQLVPRPPAWKFRRLYQLYALMSSKSFFSLFSDSHLMQKKIDQLLEKNNYDVVQMEFPIMAHFNLKTNAVKILDEHNVEYDNFKGMWKYQDSPLKKLHYKKEYEKNYKEEIYACKKMDGLFVVSDRDKSILDNEVPSLPKFLVPNGVDTSYFKPSDIVPEPYSIVFTGMMGYVPNHDGMHYFLDKIFPFIQKKIPQAKLYIVGSKPPQSLLDRASKDIIVTGYVDDVRDYVWKSSLYVVPLRSGGGTRLKVLEALSMKKPVVSTTIGCVGIDVVNNDSIFIEDDPKRFADKCVEILSNNIPKEGIVNKGYELIKEKYDWDIVVNNMDSVLRTLKYQKDGNDELGIIEGRAS